MDYNLLLASFAFGVIGMGMFMYGKKTAHPVPLAAGAGLMVIPYFITHIVIMVIVCSALAALPWLFRDK